MSKYTKESELKSLHGTYKIISMDIEARLKEFEQVWLEANDEVIFRELVFCLFTPQSKAKSCWSSVERICEIDLLVRGSAEQISKELNGVRFHHTKAARVVEARKHIPGLKARIAGFKDAQEARDWLVLNINGMGMKEASHFLRNLGMGRDLAILDRHILKNLVLLGIINDLLTSLARKRYLEIEDRMVQFSEQIGIPMAHLDMLLWYKEAGEIFK
ncbi:MAG: N-glycosylase/DNA lyase [Thermoplasmata archaeon]|nr:N-glycosylase/DNA lyase [Thermoplasmata archaeon]